MGEKDVRYCDVRALGPPGGLTIIPLARGLGQKAGSLRTAWDAGLAASASEEKEEKEARVWGVELGEGAVRISGTRQGGERGEALEKEKEGAYAVLPPTPNPAPSPALPILKVLVVS